MTTISENLQTIKNSTNAIKQAIIDKGGTVSGDITTWASAISGIETGGGSSESEYTFTGTLTYDMTEVVITGSLNKIPDTDSAHLLVLDRFTGGICYGTDLITNTGPYTLTLDYKEPLFGDVIPAMCILIRSDPSSIIPVKLIVS